MTDPCLEGHKRTISLKAAIVGEDSGSNMTAGFMDFQAVFSHCQDIFSCRKPNLAGFLHEDT